MGLDFIRRAARSFTKSWNHGANTLAQPTLFTRYPECRTRSVIVQLDDHVVLPLGSQLMVCSQTTSLILVHETTQVGIVHTPPPDLFRAIQDAGGHAVGQIACVNPLSGTADVEIE